MSRILVIIIVNKLFIVKGISLAVDSKYYVNIINKPINKLYFLEINFFSLQFDESWSFIINKTKNSFDIIQTIGKTNLFLEAILKVFICFILTLEEKIINIRRCLNIFIFFDSYFYSTKNIKEKKILEKDFRIYKFYIKYS